MIHIGLCNSIMHWKSRSKNHEKAAFLVIFGTTFYLWSISTIVLFNMGVDAPYSGNFKYLLPITCIVLASILNHFSFKHIIGYRHSLKAYKSLSKPLTYIINLIAVLFVFGSPATYILVTSAVIGI
jgi:hypothetical protein